MPTHRVGDAEAALEPDAQRREAAAYVAALTDDLGKIARRSGLGTLAYLLDMARLEAETAANASPRDAGRPAARRAASKPALDRL